MTQRIGRETVGLRNAVPPPNSTLYRRCDRLDRETRPAKRWAIPYPSLGSSRRNCATGSSLRDKVRRKSARYGTEMALTDRFYPSSPLRFAYGVINGGWGATFCGHAPPVKPVATATKTPRSRGRTTGMVGRRVDREWPRAMTLACPRPSGKCIVQAVMLALTSAYAVCHPLCTGVTPERRAASLGWGLVATGSAGASNASGQPFQRVTQDGRNLLATPLNCASDLRANARGEPAKRKAPAPCLWLAALHAGGGPRAGVAVVKRERADAIGLIGRRATARAGNARPSSACDPA